TLERGLLNIIKVLLGIYFLVVLVHENGLEATLGLVRRHFDGVADAVVHGELRLHAPAVGPVHAVGRQDAVGRHRWRRRAASRGSNTGDSTRLNGGEGQARSSRAQAAGEEALGRINHAQYHRVKVSILVLRDARRDVGRYV